MHLYIGNKSTKELHNIDCCCIEQMNKSNKVKILNLEQAAALGFDDCGHCHPYASQSEEKNDASPSPISPHNSPSNINPNASPSLFINKQTEMMISGEYQGSQHTVKFKAAQTPSKDINSTITIDNKYFGGDIEKTTDNRVNIKFRSSKTPFSKTELTEITKLQKQIWARFKGSNAPAAHIKLLSSLADHINTYFPNYIPADSTKSIAINKKTTKKSRATDVNARRTGPCIYIGERIEGHFDLISGKEINEWATVGAKSGDEYLGCAGSNPINFTGWTYNAFDHDLAHGYIRKSMKRCFTLADKYFNSTSTENELKYLDEIHSIIIDMVIGENFQAAHDNFINQLKKKDISLDKKNKRYKTYLQAATAGDWLGAIGLNGIDEFIPAAVDYLLSYTCGCASERPGIESQIENTASLKTPFSSQEIETYSNKKSPGVFYYFNIRHEMDDIYFDFAIKESAYIYLIITKSEPCSYVNGKRVNSERVKTLLKGTGSPELFSANEHISLKWDGSNDISNKLVMPSGQYMLIAQAIKITDGGASDEALTSIHQEFFKPISIEGHFAIIEILLDMLNELIKNKGKTISLKLLEKLQFYLNIDVYLNQTPPDKMKPWEKFLYYLFGIFLGKGLQRTMVPTLIRKTKTHLLEYLGEAKSAIPPREWAKRILTDISRHKLDNAYREWTRLQFVKAYGYLEAVSPAECAIARTSKSVINLDISMVNIKASSLAQRKELIKILLTKPMVSNDWKKIIEILKITKADTDAQTYTQFLDSILNVIYSDLPNALLGNALPYLPADAAATIAIKRESKSVILDHIKSRHITAINISKRATLNQILLKPIVGIPAEEKILEILRISWNEDSSQVEKLASLSGGKDLFYQRIHGIKTRNALKRYLPYFVKCIICNGDGQIFDLIKPEKCKNCGGKGVIRKKVLCPKNVWNKQKVKCAYCNGKGCWRCLKKGYTYKNVKTQCKKCEGKGYYFEDKKCIRCLGDGIINNLVPPHPCKACKGTGEVQKL